MIKEVQTAKGIRKCLVKLNSDLSPPPSPTPISLTREEVNENDRLMFKEHNLIILAAVKKENVANNLSGYWRIKKKV